MGDADREVYEIVRGLRDGLRDGESFDIARPEDPLRERLLAGEEELAPLTLVDCLRIASENSRDYQAQREGLYLVALDLTLARWDFSVRETGTFGAFLVGAGNAPTTASGSAGYGIRKLFATGLSMVGDLTFGVARDISRGDGWDAFSNASLSVTQPLLRGFGRDVVLEPLTQAERDVVYQARAYERFRATFGFDVAARFYRILEQGDVLENERQNERGLRLLRERNEAFAEAGRLNDIQVDQARQNELRARNRVIEAERTLAALLDDFKLFLGLPIETPLELDTEDGADLADWPALDLEITPAAVIDVGLASRLDYSSDLDRVQDAERRAEVARDDLRSALDLTLGVGVGSEPDRPFRYDRDAFDATLGLTFDAPLDRLRERNVYRERLIQLDRARRDAEEAGDRIRVDLRDSLRRLAAARESYTIQSGAVVLAERRVESAQLNLEAGRASTRDVLEAQEDLVQAQNAATSALTDTILSGLAMYRDMELVRVEDEGIVIDTEPLVERLAEEAP